MVRKALSFYAIQYGGVPMTQAGRERFIFHATAGGYTIDEITDYLLSSQHGPPKETAKRDVAEMYVTGVAKAHDLGENWCAANKDRILVFIDEEMAELQSGCEQETCPMSNLQKGQYQSLKKLKEFIEGLKW